MMKRLYIIFVFAIFLSILVIRFSADEVSAVVSFNEDDVTVIEAGKSASGNFEGGVNKIFSVSPPRNSILTITIKGYVEDIMNVSLFSTDNPEAVLSDDSVSYDASTGYAIKTFEIYAGPRAYYISISHAIVVIQGTYKIETKYKEIPVKYSTNNSKEKALTLKNNDYLRGVIDFDEEADYYNLVVGKDKKLNFQIKNPNDDNFIYFTLYGPDGTKVTSLFAYKSKPYLFLSDVEPGTYTLMIRRERNANPMGLMYEIITGSYVGVDNYNLLSNLSLTIGDIYQLSPTSVMPDNATETFTYKSSNPNVVSVTGVGRLKALKKGKATITVQTKNGMIQKSCIVTVKEIAVSKITLNKTSVSLYVDQSTTLTASILPANATNKNVTWKSSNAKIAAVSKNGKVTAKAVGVCTITCTAGSKSATARIQVIKKTITPTPTPKVTPKPTPVTEIKITSYPSVLNVGETKTIKISILPSNATNKAVIWTSKNTSVLSVSNGNVTGLKTGDAVVEVKTKDGKVVARCTILVK